jgi:hypothetical protein
MDAINFRHPHMINRHVPQLSALNGQLKEAETLTQDVMRDLHNVKLDISNYAVSDSSRYICSEVVKLIL